MTFQLENELIFQDVLALACILQYLIKGGFFKILCIHLCKGTSLRGGIDKVKIEAERAYIPVDQCMRRLLLGVVLHFVLLLPRGL